MHAIFRPILFIISINLKQLIPEIIDFILNCEVLLTVLRNYAILSQFCLSQNCKVKYI